MGRVIVGTLLMALTGSTVLAQVKPPQPGTNKAFCLQSSAGVKECSYDTMGQCEAAKKGNSDTCAANNTK